MKRRRDPWEVRLWIWRHRRHGIDHISRTISVPAFDPSARGILAVCSCGKTGAW